MESDAPDLDPLTEEYRLWREAQALEPDFATALLLDRMTEDAEALGMMLLTEGEMNEPE